MVRKFTLSRYSSGSAGQERWKSANTRGLLPPTCGQGGHTGGGARDTGKEIMNFGMVRSFKDLDMLNRMI